MSVLLLSCLVSLKKKLQKLPSFLSQKAFRCHTTERNKRQTKIQILQSLSVCVFALKVLLSVPVRRAVEGKGITKCGERRVEM